MICSKSSNILSDYLKNFSFTFKLKYVWWFFQNVWWFARNIDNLIFPANVLYIACKSLPKHGVGRASIYYNNITSKELKLCSREHWGSQTHDVSTSCKSSCKSLFEHTRSVEHQHDCQVVSIHSAWSPLIPARSWQDLPWSLGDPRAATYWSTYNAGI